jgi:hypothetical protein
LFVGTERIRVLITEADDDVEKQKKNKKNAPFLRPLQGIILLAPERQQQTGKNRSEKPPNLILFCLD